MSYNLKNRVFFILFVIFNPRTIKALINGLYLPIYIQFEWLKNYRINTIIDVGAFKGIVSQTLGYMFPQSTIYAFEPLKKNHRAIKSRIKGNRLKISSYALSNKKGITTFYVNSLNELSSLLPLYKTKVGYKYPAKTKAIKVETTTLDDYFSKEPLSKPIFLKLDTQGTEGLILMGAKKLLTEVAFIHVELSYGKFYERQLLFDEVYGLLKKNGFVYYGEVAESYFYPKFGPQKQTNCFFVKPHLLKLGTKNLKLKEAT